MCHQLCGRSAAPLLPTHAFYLILRSPATIACPCRGTSNCPTGQAMSHCVQVPEGGWFSLMMAGIYAYIMLLWYYGSSRKNKYAISCLAMMQQTDRSQHLACRRLDLAPCPPSQRHVQLSLYDTSRWTTHVLCASCASCRFFEATRRQLGDLLRVRHPKAGAIVTKPQPALASARGKLQLCVQFLSFPSLLRHKLLHI